MKLTRNEIYFLTGTNIYSFSKRDIVIVASRLRKREIQVLDSKSKRVIGDADNHEGKWMITRY